MSDVSHGFWPFAGLSFLWMWFMAVGGLVYLAALAFWIWMIVDCVRREFGEPTMKVVWILVIIFAHTLGAIIYYFVGRPQGRLARPPSPT